MKTTIPLLDASILLAYSLLLGIWTGYTIRRFIEYRAYKILRVTYTRHLDRSTTLVRTTLHDSKGNLCFDTGYQPLNEHLIPEEP